MKLDNPFSLEVRLLYLYCYSCFNCGRSDLGLELHHIIGRQSDSAFNACPLCKSCHNKVGHNQEEERHFFNLNLDFLVGQRYKPKEKDYQFIRDFPYLAISQGENR